MSEKFLGGSGGSLANGLNFKESAKQSDQATGNARASKKKNQVPKSPTVMTSPRK